MQRELWPHARHPVHDGKMQVWISSDAVPPRSVALQRVAEKRLIIQLLCDVIPNSKASVSSDSFGVVVDFGEAQLYTCFFVCLTATPA